MKPETTSKDDDTVKPIPKNIPKNIVLCSDGTGNRGGKDRGTNVWRLFKAVDRLGHRESENNPVQVVFYDDGVGTEDFKLFKVLGGAIGWGLSRNIQDLYTHLVKVYEPGDRLYLFGFSRGAFTVRALAGLICRCGIVDRHRCLSDDRVREKVKEAFKAYRLAINNRTGAHEFKAVNAARVDKIRGRPHDVPIQFLGVWDTVDAVGLPVDELVDALDRVLKYVTPSVRFRFENHALHPLVQKACHAVAIDDERHTFHPVLWDENLSKGKADEYYQDAGIDPPAPEERIEQVWFAGVHSNVGGGYPKDQLALVTLDWMMTKAQEEGLKFTEEDWKGFQREANVHGKLYDSRAGLAAYYRYKPRDLNDYGPKYRLKQGDKSKPVRLHASVLRRIARSTEDYAPAHIPLEYELETLGVQGAEVPPEQDQPARFQQLAGAKAWVRPRRWLYLAFLAWTGVFLVQTARLPDLAQTAQLSGGWRILSPVFGLAEWLSPEILDGRINALRNAPEWFLFYVAGLLGLVRLRQHFKAKMRSASQAAWRRSYPLASVFPGTRFSPEHRDKQGAKRPKKSRAKKQR